MSDRSLKRVFGESRLERRCRLLFVVCLSSLLFVTFWWVESVAEDLVQRATLVEGRRLVDVALIRYHLVDLWEQDPALRQLAGELARDLQTQKYEWTILGLDDSPVIQKPANPEEERVLRQLQTSWQQQLRASGTGLGGPQPVASGPTHVTNSSELAPVYFYRPVPNDQAIHYYQPVYWRNSCSRCHTGTQAGSTASKSDRDAPSGKLALPFRVVKVIIPDRETRQAVAWNRALLTAFGIITVFVVMIAAYVIIRVVVVKPLQRLRLLSDGMNIGQADPRPDGRVSDDVAKSADDFQRLLHQLTDG
jgi:hypothetical protein